MSAYYCMERTINKGKKGVIIMAKRPSLGRGLGALIQEVPVEESTKEWALDDIAHAPIEKIKKNPWQPRKHFEADALHDLIMSIKEHGILQPLLVRTAGDDFELIAGERRFRAAQEAELEEVPVIIMDIPDQEALELALIENLQREDLSPLEEAEGYQALSDTFQLTQEQIADRVGKGRATIANALRLLALPDEIKSLLSQGLLSAGHAKVLVGMDDPHVQVLLAGRVAKENLSVRALEKIIAKLHAVPRKSRAKKADIPSGHIQYLSEILHRKLGTSVRITPCKTLANGKKTRGSIEIDYFSSDELDRLLIVLGVSEEI